MKRGLVALAILFTVAGCGADDRVVVAAGTTLVDSGFIERVFEDLTETRTSVVTASSREALALGAAGSVELLITHLPDAEAEFLTEHPGAEQSPVFSSEFVLVGPAGTTLNAADAVEAFRKIAAGGHPFVARGDGSGTAAKERELWELAGIDPTGEPWYIETGQGMGFTLQVADQRDAFTLAEIGSFLAAEYLSLVAVVVGDDDERLVNPYQLTLVAGASEEARALFDSLLGPHASEVMIGANLELFGEVLYSPTSPEVQV